MLKKMKKLLTNSSMLLSFPPSSPSLALSGTLKNPKILPKSTRSPNSLHLRSRLLLCSSNRLENADVAIHGVGPSLEGGDGLGVGIGNPSLPARIGMYRASIGDRAFFLLAFIACTTSVAFASLVAAAVPTLYAMRRAAISLAKLADIAREELPSTMAAVRLSGMEISDLTLELSDLSQEISDGVTKSAQAVQAAEAGVRKIGVIAHTRTMSMIEERANLPNISVQPMVVGAARKTSNAVGRAKRTLMNFISRSDNHGDENAKNIEF